MLLKAKVLMQKLFTKKVWIEFVDAILVVGAVVIVWMIGLYYNVFWIELQDIFSANEAGAVIEMTSQRSISDEWVQKFWGTLLAHNSARSEVTINDKLDALQAQESQTQRIFEYSLDEYIDGSIAQYDLPFSMVPPGRFISIPSLNIQAPIETVPFATPDQIKNGEFDEQLKKWIVKYPFTSTPWNPWNTLLFGHSSVDALQAWDNDFWFVFYKLPKLEEGALIQVVWDWEMHEYEVEEKLIKRPKDVPAIVNQKSDTDILTLMACYPLMSDAQRILIKAVPKWTRSTQLVTTKNTDEDDS